MSRRRSKARSAVVTPAPVWPYWQTEPCPTWCQAAHRDRDHQDDRSHDGAELPVRLRQHAPVDLGGAWGPSMLNVYLHQHVDHRFGTVVLTRDFGPEELVLTAAEARTLARRLVKAADRLDGRPRRRRGGRR